MIRILSSVSPSPNQRICAHFVKMNQAQKPSQTRTTIQLPVALDQLERAPFPFLVLALQPFFGL